VAVALSALLFRSEEFAIRIGNWTGRIASWVRGLLHKPPVTTWGEGAARFRRDTIALVEHRWVRLSLFTVLSQVALFIVLLLSLRHLGVSEQEVSTAESSPCRRSRDFSRWWCLSLPVASVSSTSGTSEGSRVRR
jgi:hypothetical protein